MDSNSRNDYNTYVDRKAGNRTDHSINPSKASINSFALDTRLSVAAKYLWLVIWVGYHSKNAKYFVNKG